MSQARTHLIRRTMDIAAETMCGRTGLLDLHGRGSCWYRSTSNAGKMAFKAVSLKLGPVNCRNCLNAEEMP